MSDPRFPIGKFTYTTPPTPEQREQYIQEIAETPQKLRDAVRGFSGQQFNTPYRDGGWTVLQVVHHVPESHMNAYIRFKLALTEDQPTIKAYMEDRWANLPDVNRAEPEISLALLDSLHQRWLTVLRTIRPEDWTRSFHHPEIGVVSLERCLALYAWHGRHHVAHVTELRKRMGW